jgi:hypothetical protein
MIQVKITIVSFGSGTATNQNKIEVYIGELIVGKPVHKAVIIFGGCDKF